MPLSLLLFTEEVAVQEEKFAELFSSLVCLLISKTVIWIWGSWKPQVFRLCRQMFGYLSGDTCSCSSERAVCVPYLQRLQTDLHSCFGAPLNTDTFLEPYGGSAW